MSTKGRLLQIADDLQVEIGAIERICEEAAQCCRELSARAPTSLERRGAGDILHDFYGAAERALERVAVEMNGGAPGGSDSHVQLLQRMARELPGVRPAVLSEPTARQLVEYLRFRHLFRHRYGFELEWDWSGRRCGRCWKASPTWHLLSAPSSRPSRRRSCSSRRAAVTPRLPAGPASDLAPESLTAGVDRS